MIGAYQVGDYVLFRRKIQSSIGCHYDQNQREIVTWLRGTVSAVHDDDGTMRCTYNVDVEQPCYPYDVSVGAWQLEPLRCGPRRKDWTF